MVDLVDPDDVRMRVAALRKHLPGARIHYAINGNAEPGVEKALADVGIGFDAASIFDIERLAGHGCDLSDVVFAAAVKPVDDVAAAYEFGVRAFVAGSLAEVTKIATVAPGSSVYLRVADGDRRSDVATLGRFARDRGLEAVGLSVHVGGHTSRPHVWAEAIRHVVPVYHELAAEGLDLAWLSIRGGLPCGHSGDSSLDQIGAAISEARRELPDRVGLIVVPDRQLMASAARLVATVIGRAEREATSWLFLNAACHTGMFEAIANAGRGRAIERVDRSVCSGMQQFSLAGPTGDFADVIARGVELPSDTGLGDRLVFG